MIQEALGHLGVVSGAPLLPIFTIQMALPSWVKPNLVKISKFFWLFDDLYDEFYDEGNLVFVAKDFYLFQLNYFWMPLTEILQIILFVLLRGGHVTLFFLWLRFFRYSCLYKWEMLDAHVSPTSLFDCTSVPPMRLSCLYLSKPMVSVSRQKISHVHWRGPSILQVEGGCQQILKISKSPKKQTVCLAKW